MHSSLLLLAVAGSGLVQAQAAMSTAMLFLPGADQQPLQATIAGSDASATTYVISCPPNVSSYHCGYTAPFTLTEGPSTVLYTIPGDSFSQIVNCKLSGTTSAICTQSYGGSNAANPGVSSTTLAASDITLLPVMIVTDLTASMSVSSAPAATTDHGASTTGAATGSGTNTAAATGPTSSTAAAASSRRVGLGMGVAGLMVAGLAML